MTELEKIIGYKFNNPELLTTALTHSSYANEHSDYFHCNERLMHSKRKRRKTRENLAQKQRHRIS